MPDSVAWLDDEVWETVVANVPILAVDLVVESPDGIVLGRRTKEPACGKWFVPGGRVRKGETLEAAVHRVACQELGVEVKIRERLGPFEHFYETAEEGTVGGKHYVPIGFTVETDGTTFDGDYQHDEVRAFDRAELPELHEYVRAYLDEAGVFADA